ncbi:hypothetical protein RRG08_006047 [Elysia crispata]|uniref:Apolipoprotein D n=1 Tax=Elysia crispata TaxID=231223 RepID=A0AAE0Z3V8_9GAST|nr:hypothetical protein RRG08_006047 [Elysia crispata]
MQILASAVVVALGLGLATAATVQGPCPSVTSQSTLDADRYVGKWYELKRFPNRNQGMLSCTSALYTLEPDNTVTVMNQGYFPNGTKDSIEGTAQVVDVSKPAELSVDFGFGWPADKPNYFIRQTDYDTYSVVFSCMEFSNVHVEYAWILTRERNADIDVDALEQDLADAGPCPTVTSQSTLDVDRYVGKWYELKQFPNLNQLDLSCTSALYILAADRTVTVKNQGYFNGTKDSFEGTAQVVDVSKPAELSVNFGFVWSTDEPNYVIRQTDYDTYSVVFSCTEVFNIHLEYAWILTRERNADIDVDALEQDLADAGIDVGNFETVDQDDCPDN